MGPQDNPAFRPPLLLPGGPPTRVQQRQPSTHRAETHIPGPTQHYHRPSLTVTSAAATSALHHREVYLPNDAYSTIQTKMDPSSDSTTSSTQNSDRPTTPPMSQDLAYDHFDVSELYAQLPAQQQQHSDNPTQPADSTPPYEEDRGATAPRDEWDYESPETPEEPLDVDHPDDGPVLPPTDHPRAPRGQSLMALLLKNRFYQVYGEDWRQFYVLPNLRRSLLQEIRNNLARDVDQAMIQGDDIPGDRPDDRPRCRCYLHRFFGVHAHILFPACTRRDHQ